MSDGWGWGNLFGGNAKATKDTTKNAILGLRGTLDMLSKREKHLQNQMDEQDAVARKNVSTNKNCKSSLATVQQKWRSKKW
jgi:charged multivesicular body protein 4